MINTGGCDASRRLQHEPVDCPNASTGCCCPAFVRQIAISRGGPAACARAGGGVERGARAHRNRYVGCSTANWFIETCDEWVGAVHRRPDLAEESEAIKSAGRQRARRTVAKTIAYRRRKGHAVVLEQLREPPRLAGTGRRILHCDSDDQHMKQYGSRRGGDDGHRTRGFAELADGAFDAFADTSRCAIRRLEADDQHPETSDFICGACARLRGRRRRSGGRVADFAARASRVRIGESSRRPCD